MATETLHASCRHVNSPTSRRQPRRAVRRHRAATHQRSAQHLVQPIPPTRLSRLEIRGVPGRQVVRQPHPLWLLTDRTWGLATEPQVGTLVSTSSFQLTEFTIDHQRQLIDARAGRVANWLERPRARLNPAVLLTATALSSYYTRGTRRREHRIDESPKRLRGTSCWRSASARLRGTVGRVGSSTPGLAPVFLSNRSTVMPRRPASRSLR